MSGGLADSLVGSQVGSYLIYLGVIHFTYFLTTHELRSRINQPAEGARVETGCNKECFVAKLGLTRHRQKHIIVHARNHSPKPSNQNPAQRHPTLNQSGQLTIRPSGQGKMERIFPVAQDSHGTCLIYRFHGEPAPN